MQIHFTKTITIIICILIISILSISISGCVRAKKTKNKPQPVEVNEYSSVKTYDGIDISHHNGDIDFTRLPKHIKFIYIKATEGATYLDPKYKKYVKDARDNGFKIGSYHYFRMTSSAHTQFANIKKNIKKGEQDLIPMIDVETSDKHSKAKLQDSLSVLIKLMEDYYGSKPLIYGTMRSYNTYLAPKFNNHILYIGRYGSNPPQINGSPKYVFWQFSEKGKAEGMKKNCDLVKMPKGFEISTIYK